MMIHSAVFWLAVSMVCFLLLAGKPLRKAVVALLDRERSVVAAQLEQANRLRREAEAMLVRAKAEEEEAAAKAAALVQEALADAEHIRAEAAEKIKRVIADREAQALSKIAAAEEAAVREAQAMAARLAVEASRELIRQKLGAAQSDALVEKSILELPAHLN